MRTYRVPVVLVDTKNGYIEIEAGDQFAAAHAALLMDRWELWDNAVFEGTCGDYWEIEVLYEQEAEDVTPPSVSDGLWL